MNFGNRPLSFTFYSGPALLARRTFRPGTVKFVRGQYPEGVLPLVMRGVLPITKIQATGFEGGTLAVHFA